ncbi:Uncharacterized protein ADU37_CDS12760 [Thermococcus sp. 2319x1]|uniref:DUF530 family protein n=1 Tax=Thermococcus sp. 2319x1 TaxID=1674923 RepID=UPI00073AC63B|nr:DUF530 family protein [Thermococcus sp. 2319x1]ALV62975.1 Uncharacterized protein ADU37_CDS12760 [Thermococcus sp. 2319x1]
MTTTEELIAQINRILDDIKINMGRLFENFDPLYLAFNLNRNLAFLKDLEEELSRRVSEALSYTMSSKRERDPHIRRILLRNHYRMLTLERLRTAITAHKIALATIESSYTFYKGKKIIEVKDITNKEELDSIRIFEKPIKLGRMEILPHLAYSGDVLRILGQKSNKTRDTFKEIKSKLKEKGQIQKKGMRIEVEYWQGGRLKKERVELPVDADIDGELKKRFGQKFRWRLLTYVKTKGVLINSHYTIDNLSLAYASLYPEDGARILALDLFRYYYLTSEKERETIGLYPQMRPCIDCHYSIFDLPFMDEPEFRTGFGSMLIIKKCEVETLLSGKRSEISNIPNYLLGGVVLYGVSPFDEEKVSKLLGIDEEELKEAIEKFVLSGLHMVLFEDTNKFEKFMPKSDKAKQFLELLQG